MQKPILVTPLKLVLPVAAVLAAVCGFNAQADMCTCTHA